MLEIITDTMGLKFGGRIHQSVVVLEFETLNSLASAAASWAVET